MHDWSFQLPLGLVTEMSIYTISKQEIGQTLGKHWLDRFLKRNPTLLSTLELD